MKKNCVIYNDSVMKKIVLPSLEPLKGVTLDIMIKRIAYECITFEDLKDTYKEIGITGIKNVLFSKKNSGKPGITKDSRVLKKINAFLS